MKSATGEDLYINAHMESEVEIMDRIFHISVESTNKGMAVNIEGSPFNLALGVSILITDISKRFNIDVNTFMGAVKEIMCKTTRIDLGNFQGLSFSDENHE